MNIALWIIQILVALMFLFAGGTKLYYSPEVLAAHGTTEPGAPAGALSEVHRRV